MADVEALDPLDRHAAAFPSPPTLIVLPEQRVAVIRLQVPRTAMRSVMGPAIAELHAALAAQQVQPAGPLFTYHRRIDDAVFDCAVGRPIGQAVSPAGRVAEAVLPATAAAHACLHGAYEGLPEAWGHLRAWVAARGLAPAGDLREVYTIGPATCPDPADWRTDLFLPLSGEGARAAP